MPDGADKPEQPSILHRRISNRAMEIFLVVFAISAVIFIVITPVTCTQRRNPQWIHDMANVRQIIVTMQAYAEDHDAHLPLNMLYVEDYLDTKDVFHSRYDDEASLVYDETPEPGWYQYGSYWFLSEPGLTLYADHADAIMLAYRTPRVEHEFYIVGYLDGSAQVLTPEAFEEQKKQHDKRLMGDRSSLAHLPDPTRLHDQVKPSIHADVTELSLGDRVTITAEYKNISETDSVVIECIPSKPAAACNGPLRERERSP